jgi:TonB family protein
MRYFVQETGSLQRQFALSVLAHALLVALLAWAAGHSPISVPAGRWTTIEIDPGDKAREAPQPLRKAEPEKIPDRRIVQTERGQKTAKAAPDAFLGEQTQIVDRQTVNANHQINMGHAKSDSHPKPASPAIASAKPLPQAAVPPKLNQLGLAILPSAKELAKINQEFEKNEPRWASMDGEHTPQDYIHGMTESNHTAINTREYKFFGYYQRIREKLDRAWVPILKEKLYHVFRAGRQLASDMDHVTKVMVVLNPGGEVVRVQVQSESGTSELDEAAVKAFNKAGPFPNPPHGIVDADGEIRIPWEFILRS